MMLVHLRFYLNYSVWSLEVVWIDCLLASEVQIHMTIQIQQLICKTNKHMFKVKSFEGQLHPASSDSAQETLVLAKAIHNLGNP